MTIKTYSKHLNVQSTPQTSPIPGKVQVQNSAGGFSFEVSDWTKLDRFLVLGTEGGTYYASEREVTLKSAEAVERLLKTDGKKVVDRIVEISDTGRAPKNDTAIFALAMALKKGDTDTRRLAANSVSKVCRIGTHIFQFAEAVKALGGWGRLTHKAFEDWYKNQEPDRLAQNLVKYQSREGWSHRDLLRKVKVRPTSKEMTQAFKWAVGKLDGQTLGDDVPALIRGFELAKKATSETEICKLIKEYNLPRECVPTEHLNSKKVWEALLTSGKGMPLTAMIRNLGKMSQIGLLDSMSDATKFVVGRLEDGEALRKARVHPIQILMANRTYGSGHGMKGSLTWQVNKNIADALEEAYYTTFANVEPTGKNFLLALDVSGSMGSGEVAGTPMTPRDASAAMAMVTMRSEKWHETVGFTAGVAGQWNSGNARNRSWGGGNDGITSLDISAKDRLDSVIKKISNLPFGGTDCALPMIYATAKKLPVDVFVVYTDSETWAGGVHPVQALKEYRQKSGRPAKLVVVGLVANDFSVADPSDAGMIDVVGFDANVPAIIRNFVLEGNKQN
jgi:60 kDa SS-A/Ro ribonucleoprotein